tara:strand:+ start:3993 stop:7268 length:3276 start_codon:yes stop_codon:yes gene_type:complete
VRISERDRDGRIYAVNPSYNVALQASAGTGKTHVLVERYLNLLRAGVDPSNILAITFTRKAASEIKERIVSALRGEVASGKLSGEQWNELRDRLGDITIGTIDAFCLMLLREFPLEANVDPGFSMASESEGPRLVRESLDRTMRTCRSFIGHDEDVDLVFSQLREHQIRHGLATLLNRRIIAREVLNYVTTVGPQKLTIDEACQRAARGLRGVFNQAPDGLSIFLKTGPLDLKFDLLSRDLRALVVEIDDSVGVEQGIWKRLLVRVEEHFLTQAGQPRKRLNYKKSQFSSDRDWDCHRKVVVENASAIKNVLLRYRRDLNAILSRGVWRLYQVAESEYRHTLETNAVLDFTEVLLSAIKLLGQMDEFSQSRYRLESRYHHILVDEFQDTSRAQWKLISLLVQSWGEGAGLAHSGPLEPSIFVVGDSKQSIYGFRDADVLVFEEAARFLKGLRPGYDINRSISKSFRSVPALLSFFNNLCAAIKPTLIRADAFQFKENDQFPIPDKVSSEHSDALGMIAADSLKLCAAKVVSEIERLLATEKVRDRVSGVSRQVIPGDIAILFRTRDSHREFETALEMRGIPAYVYKGLGFFETDEVKDILALLSYLSDPRSNLCCAAWLRSRFVRMSDEGLRQLAPHIATMVLSSQLPPKLDPYDDKLLLKIRSNVPRWLSLVDSLPPAELLDHVLSESAYSVELKGPRLQQGRENLKKIRALIRRLQNSGYSTVASITEHLSQLSTSDESNAVIDAVNAVNLMTVHAAKGLEFPIVFVVDVTRGTAPSRDPICVTVGHGDASLPTVSVGNLPSDTDQNTTDHESEETKRLLYVAVTRARDRLYLAAIVKNGHMRVGRNSLAEVMPSSLAKLFEEATDTASQTIEWLLPSGEAHQFHVCKDMTHIRTKVIPKFQESLDDFSFIADASIPRRPASKELQDAYVFKESLDTDKYSNRLLGTLVHRLIARKGIAKTGTSFSAHSLKATIATLLRTDEVVEVAANPQLSEQVVDAYRTLSNQPEVQILIREGETMHEIPFSLQTETGISAGTIDCVVRSPNGCLTVLEFKTGRRRSEHRQQLDLYRQAVSSMAPHTQVEACLVYV